MLKIIHNSGFFSCCSIRLLKIVEFLNSQNKLPDSVDSAEQFAWYKKWTRAGGYTEHYNHKLPDITFDYFEHYDKIRAGQVCFPNAGSGKGAKFKRQLSRFVGVAPTFDKLRKWRATICYGGRQHFLGENFESEEAAAHAYDAAARGGGCLPGCSAKHDALARKHLGLGPNPSVNFPVPQSGETQATRPRTSASFPINYHWTQQFTNYSNLDYIGVTPLIKKYFSPSVEINGIINNIEKKYNLVYDNICVLFYRGNDKNRETKICGYDEYLEHANKIITKNPHILFLIQSDETEFIEFMRNKFPDNSFYFKDEIRHMKKCDSSVDILERFRPTNHKTSKKYLAITIIMSKCKYIICGSGNCDIFIMWYRGNNKNVIQNLNGTWHNSLI